jgi:hypothetical protein
MLPETRRFLLRDGESIEVTKDLANRRLTFVLPGFPPFEMHIRQGWHLARFLAGIESIMDEDEHPRPEPELDDTKPLRVSAVDLDLSDVDDDFE